MAASARSHRVSEPSRRSSRPIKRERMRTKLGSPPPHASRATARQPSRGLPSRSSRFGEARVSEGWRRGRDSNPRYPSGYSGFQDHRHRPLGHLSIYDRRGPLPGAPQPWRRRPPRLARYATLTLALRRYAPLCSHSSSAGPPAWRAVALGEGGTPLAASTRILRTARRWGYDLTSRSSNSGCWTRPV
jgi:hypothetical protein